MKRFLLDTGILLGLISEAPWALWARSEFGLTDGKTVTFTSVICRGELLALAEKRGWGEGKRKILREVLNEFPTLDINREDILKAYAFIDAWTHGKPLDSPEHPFPPPRPARSMTQNDIWIAATASASGAVLLSTDKDFAHLHDKWITFVYVDPKMSLPEN